MVILVTVLQRLMLCVSIANLYFVFLFASKQVLQSNSAVAEKASEYSSDTSKVKEHNVT